MVEANDYYHDLHNAAHQQALRKLRSMALEFEPTLTRLPGLGRELERLMSNVDGVDLDALTERVMSALEQATALTIEFDTLDADILNHPEMAKLLALAEERITIASVSAFAKKIHALLDGLSRESSAHRAKSDSQPGNSEFDQAEALYKPVDGQLRDVAQAVTIYSRLAERNHAKACARLSDIYRSTDLPDVKQDSSKAIEFLRKAVEAGDPQSMAKLSLCYQNKYWEDVGLPRNFDQAKFLANRAIELGCREGWHALGKLYLIEDYPERDAMLALTYLQKGADSGCPYSWGHIGYLYDSGVAREIPKNIRKAIAAYEKSYASAGPDEDFAAADLAMCYEFGEDGVRDKQRALEWYNKASISTKKQVCISIGWKYKRTEGEKDKAFYWFNEGARLGHHFCTDELADLYIDSGDLQNAIRLYERSIQQENYGHSELGRIYIKLGETDKAIVAIENGIDRGETGCYYILINQLVKIGNYARARHLLNQWMNNIKKSKYEIRDICLLLTNEADELRDLNKARVYCDRLISISDSNYDKGEACRALGKAMLKHEQDVRLGIRYLEQAYEFGDSCAAFDLEDIYRYGEYGVAVDIAKADAWSARRNAKTA